MVWACACSSLSTLRAPSRLWARAIAAITAVKIRKLRGLKRDELIAGLRRLQRAGRGLARIDQRVDLGVGAVEILHRARLDVHGVLKARQRVLPAGLRVGHQLLGGGRGGIGDGIGLA